MNLKDMTEQEFNDLYASVVKEKAVRKWRDYTIQSVRGYNVHVSVKPEAIVRLSINFCESEIDPAEFKKFCDWLKQSESVSDE